MSRKIGGWNIRVQVDETVLFKRKIIINLSGTLDDDEKDKIQYLIRVIEENARNNVFFIDYT